MKRILALSALALALVGASVAQATGHCGGQAIIAGHGHHSQNYGYHQNYNQALIAVPVVAAIVQPYVQQVTVAAVAAPVVQQQTVQAEVAAPVVQQQVVTQAVVAAPVVQAFSAYSSYGSVVSPILAINAGHHRQNVVVGGHRQRIVHRRGLLGNRSRAKIRVRR